MLKKIFGISLSVALTLGSQVFANEAVIKGVAEKVVQQTGEKVAVEVVEQALKTGNVAALSSLDVATKGAILTVIKEALNNGDFSNEERPNVEAVQNALSASIESVNTNEIAFDTAAQNSEVVTVNGQLDNLINNGTISQDAKSLQNIQEGTQAYATVAQNFDEVMSVANTIVDETARNNAIQGTINYFVNTDVFANMTVAGKNFVKATITADSSLYEGVDVITTTSNYLKYSDGQNQEALRCISSAAL